MDGVQLQGNYAPSSCDPLNFKCTTMQLDNERMAYSFDMDFAGIATLQHVLLASSHVAQACDQSHLSNNDQSHLSNKHGFPCVRVLSTPHSNECLATFLAATSCCRIRKILEQHLQSSQVCKTAVALSGTSASISYLPLPCVFASEFNFAKHFTNLCWISLCFWLPSGRLF